MPIIWILAVAFLIRVVGIHFGLPDLYHADEPIVVNHALAYGSGDLNPHFFKIPPLTSYLLFLIYVIYYLLGLLVGWFRGISDFAALFIVNPTSFYLIARVLFGAVTGTFTVYVLYRLVKKFFSRECAVLSAFFLAVSFLHVRDSHYIYTDIPLVLILVLCFFPLFNLLSSKGERKDYITFGWLLGVAVATKYNGVFMVIPFLLAHAFKKGFKPSAIFDLNLFSALLIALFTYALLNPFSFFDFHFFLSEILNQGKAEGFSGWWHHLVYSLNGALGFPLLAVSIFGGCLVFFQRDKKKWIVLSFVVTYYLVLCFFSQPYDRYVLPLIPFVTILGADGAAYLMQKSRLQRALKMICVGLIALPSMAKIGFSDYIFIQEDIRSIAREWVEQTISEDTKIALDTPFYLPRLQPNLAQLIQKQEAILAAPNRSGAQLKRLEALIQEAEAKPSGRYELFFLKESRAEDKFLFSRPAVPYDLEHLRKMGIQYVIISQANLELPNPFYADLDQKAQLVVQFSPYQDQLREWPIDRQPLTGGPFLWRELLARARNGQTIKIYRVNE